MCGMFISAVVDEGWREVCLSVPMCFGDAGGIFKCLTGTEDVTWSDRVGVDKTTLNLTDLVLEFLSHSI